MKIIQILPFILASIYHISLKDKPNVHLFIDNDRKLLASTKHIHQDPRYFFEIREISPGTVKIYSINSNIVLGYDKMSNKLIFDDEEDTKDQEFMIKLTDNEGYRITQNGLCLTYESPDKIHLSRCGKDKNQKFELFPNDKHDLFTPQSIMKVTYEFRKVAEPIPEHPYLD